VGGSAQENRKRWPFLEIPTWVRKIRSLPYTLVSCFGEQLSAEIDTTGTSVYCRCFHINSIADALDVSLFLNEDFGDAFDDVAKDGFLDAEDVRSSTRVVFDMHPDSLNGFIAELFDRQTF